MVQPVVYLLSSVFSPLGVIKNSGVYVKNQYKNEGNAESVDNDGYRRYDTSWQFDNQKNATSFYWVTLLPVVKRHGEVLFD